MLWGKRFKRRGQDETNPCAVSIVIVSSPGVIGSLNMFFIPSGFLYVCNVSLHWDACFFEVGLLFRFMSLPFTWVHRHQVQVFFKAMLPNFSKFRPSYTAVQNSFPVSSSQTGTQYELYLCSYLDAVGKNVGEKCLRREH